MRRIVALGALLFIGTHIPAHAQDAARSAWSSEEPTPHEQYDKSRTVNGHAFLPFLSIPWGFVTTRVGSFTGVGYYRLKAVPVLGLGSVNANAKLAAFSQTFAADFRLTRWLGLSTGFVVGNAVGINSSGAYNLGLNYAVGAGLGLIFRIAEGDKWYLSARIDGQINRAEAVLPAALTSTAHVDSNGNITFNIASLTRGGNFVQGVGAVMMAWAPNRMFGLQNYVAYDALRIGVSGDTGHVDYVKFGSGATFRFNQWGVPIALLLGANVQVEAFQTKRVFFSTINSQNSVIGAIEPGIFYSNPKYVDVGLLTSLQYAKNNNRYQAVITLNHFW